MRLTQDKGQEDEPDQPGDEYPPFPTLAEDDLASARLRCGIGWRILFRRSWFVRRLAGLFCFLSHKLPTERCGSAYFSLSFPDRKSTRLNSSHKCATRMPSSA